MDTKIQVGDKVHVEFEVGSVDGTTFTLKRGGSRHFIPRNSYHIVKHIPKPWAPKVGDKVVFKGLRTEWTDRQPSRVYSVLAVHDKVAWCISDGSYNSFEFGWLEPAPA